MLYHVITNVKFLALKRVGLLLSDRFTLPGIRAHSTHSRPVGGGGQQGGAFTDDKETLTKHGRRTLMPCHRVLSGTRALTAPAVLWSVSSQRAPRAAGTSQVLLSCESCPCQDTLCYAFFKKYLVYFFKLRLKYKSQSMGTEF